MLSTLLAKTDNTTEENVKLYLERRRIRNIKDYTIDDYVLNTLKRKFARKSIKNKRMRTSLREIEYIAIYQTDVDYVISCYKKYTLSVMQAKILFGLVFFARMYGVKYCRVGTEWKFRQFCSCFKEHIGFPDMEFVRDCGIMEIFETGDEVYNRYGKASPEIDYIYDRIENKDKEIYRYYVTVGNNKLNLNKVFQDVMPENWVAKKCAICGEEFLVTGNRQKYCVTCRSSKHKEWQRNAMKKKRAK